MIAVSVGGEGCAAPFGARTSPSKASFGSALEDALDGAALKNAPPLGKDGAAADARQDAGGPTPRGDGLPEDDHRAATGSWTIGDVLAMARAAAGGGRRGVAGGAHIRPNDVGGVIPDPRASSQIGEAAAIADASQGTATASVAADEPIKNAQAHHKENQTPFAAAVQVDALPADVPPCATTTANHLSDEAQGLDGQNASEQQDQHAGVEGASGTGAMPGAPTPGLPDVASIVASHGMAREDINELAGNAQQSAPGSGVVSPAGTIGTLDASPTGTLAGDSANQFSTAPSASGPAPRQTRTTGEFARAFAGRFGHRAASGAATPGVPDIASTAASQGMARDDITELAANAQESAPGRGNSPPAGTTGVLEAALTSTLAGDSANPFSNPILASGPAPRQIQTTGELSRASTGQLGSSLGDVPPSGTFSLLGAAVPEGVAQAGGGSAESMAAGIRASLARFLNLDVRPSTARPVTAGNEPRLVSGPLAFVADSGTVAVPAQGAEQTTSQAGVAEAGKTPFQIAHQEPIESPIWARNELAKAARLSQDIIQQVQLAAAGTDPRGGDASLDRSADRNPTREGSARPAQPFGLPVGPGASTGVGGSLATTPSTSTAVRSGETIPEPTTESGSLTHSIVRVMKLQWSQGGGEVQLRLRPEHLGELTVALRVESGAVSATLRSDSPLVRAWIEQHQQDLRTGLKESGLTLERLSVDPDGRPRDNREGDMYQPEPRAYPKRRLPTTQFESRI
ncbi:MAG: flagellar hook-length control protein FliK [Acidobacteria bacterium]|nr:flagellar hook-length control protein FliK [Acidobacteriota bacterium]